MDMSLDQLTPAERQQSYSDSFANKSLHDMQARMARAEREKENEVLDTLDQGLDTQKD